MRASRQQSSRWLLLAALVAVVVTVASGCRGDGVPVAGLEPGTITVFLDRLEGLPDLAVDAWVLPVEPTDQGDAFGGARLGIVHSDSFSASDSIHPRRGDMYFDVDEDRVVTFDPGDYRFVIEAYVPSGRMHFGCERRIEVVEGQPLVVTITSLPSYSGDGFHWTATDELRYPDCGD